MKEKIFFIFSFIAIVLIHIYVFSTVKLQPNDVAVKPQKKISPIINMRHVVIKEPEPVVEPVVEKVEPEPVVKEVIVPPKPVVIKKKAIKKVVKKKIPKKKKEKKKKRKKLVKKKKVKSKKLKKLAKKAQRSAPKSKAIKNAYLAKVRRIIEKNKKYPKMAKRMRQQGVVKVRFTIAANGSIRNISIVGASPYSKLNKAALKILRKIRSFAPIPKALGESSLSITVPIRYKITH